MLQTNKCKYTYRFYELKTVLAQHINLVKNGDKKIYLTYLSLRAKALIRH